MYRLLTANRKVEKILRNYISKRHDIPLKLDKLKLDPRRENDAHSLHGRLAGKWACWLGSNIRLIYSIDDINKTIIIQAIGSHNIY